MLRGASERRAGGSHEDDYDKKIYTLEKKLNSFNIIIIMEIKPTTIKCTVTHCCNFIIYQIFHNVSHVVTYYEKCHIRSRDVKHNKISLHVFFTFTLRAILVYRL